MSREMTSFVVRFVREASGEQGARWRGLVQHVQSGAEQSFVNFAQAVQFMQGHVMERTVETLEEEKRMVEHNPFVELTNEMSRLWGEWGPRVAEMWTQAAAQMAEQSAAFHDQLDRAVARSLKAWGLPTDAEQGAILARLDQLSEQMDRLAARVEALEKQDQKK